MVLSLNVQPPDQFVADDEAGGGLDLEAQRLGGRGLLLKGRG
jgi:hypothetical protein